MKLLILCIQVARFNLNNSKKVLFHFDWWQLHNGIMEIGYTSSTFSFLQEKWLYSIQVLKLEGFTSERNGYNEIYIFTIKWVCGMLWALWSTLILWCSIVFFVRNPIKESQEFCQKMFYVCKWYKSLYCFIKKIDRIFLEFESRLSVINM